MNNKNKQLIHNSNIIYHNTAGGNGMGPVGRSGQPGNPGLNYREYIAWCRKESIRLIFNHNG
jgi:hypothetical protein